MDTQDRDPCGCKDSPGIGLSQQIGDGCDAGILACTCHSAGAGWKPAPQLARDCHSQPSGAREPSLFLRTANREGWEAQPCGFSLKHHFASRRDSGRRREFHQTFGARPDFPVGMFDQPSQIETDRLRRQCQPVVTVPVVLDQVARAVAARGK